MRDALRQLEAEGLVVIRPHLGASVRKVDFTEFKEMCAMRLAARIFSCSSIKKAVACSA